ncbi:MAG TPA: rhodanese-like domain-containing protein [Acidimicrobiia bacterium]
MTSTRPRPRVTAAPPAGPALAARHFQWRLEFETDPSDVHADLEAGVADFVVVDTRMPAAYAAGHVPGARNLPYPEIDDDAATALDPSTTIVVYCDGPGCNAATRGAAALAARGYRVKEMIGGLEYWRREGYAIETSESETAESHVA